MVESTTPLRIHYYRIRIDSGGAGRWRGGCGFEKEYECLADNVTLSHRGERHYSQPWGRAGGQPAASSKTVVVRAGGGREVVPSKATIRLNRHDRVIMWTSGGGGFGDPRQRPAGQVREDVLDLKITPEKARQAYGVVIENGTLRERETAHLRESSQAQPPVRAETLID